MRTIVFSDVHAEPEIIERVVEDSGYAEDKDRLIFAGDAVEVGRDSLSCLERLDELGAEFLVGNHEYEIYRGTPVEWEPVDFRVEQIIDRQIRSGAWRYALEADGVLITHAGVSAQFGRAFAVAHEGDAAAIAAGLNAAWDVFAADAPLPDVDIGETMGPLWYRPDWGVPLPGVVQILGHTPPEIIEPGALARWAERGIYLIDPCVRCWRQRGYSKPVPLRYAVVDNGEVQVVG